MKRMNANVLVVALGLLMTLPAVSNAGAKITIDEDTFVTVGAGLRGSYTSVEDGVSDGEDSSDFTLESFRLYIGGQYNDTVKFEFNGDRSTDSDGDESFRMLDGVVKFEFSDYVNIWAGRFLPPSDRANLSGPYYLNGWSFPIAQKYPAIFAGRDDGVAFWGQIDGGKIKYQIGAFEGLDNVDSDGDDLLFTGRLTINLLDPEPGYYNSSTYFGGKEVLAIGLVGYSQSDVAGEAGDSGDFTGTSIDVLYETKLANDGVLTLEGAFYEYDSDDPIGDSASAQGDGYFALASYLFPNKIGPAKLQGQLQPYVRVQQYDDEITTNDSFGETDQIDIGLNYIIDGHNARLSLQISETDPEDGDEFNTIFVGFQYQI